MSFRKVCVAAISAALSVSAPLAPARAQDGGMWQVNIAGVPLSCVDYGGTPVRIYVTNGLDNVGIATRTQQGQPIIVLNPNVFARFSPTVQVWWFAHECGHHALGPYNSETNADCWGVKVMRQQGLLHSYWQLDQFARELASLPGSPTGHLPGPARAWNIANCALS
ncbi:MAG TPA: hypothetical protein VGR32_10340 [Brevundimonas sp.]|jgi:hypothetical protein|uniref:hypothetical protein n=1 Tax=Brevundimonas sp. TaxID=1871086 RepID=UPI002DED065D|nr:hypothetical protein [Brevundimonas sp.]